MKLRNVGAMGVIAAAVVLGGCAPSEKAPAAATPAAAPEAAAAPAAIVPISWDDVLDKPAKIMTNLCDNHGSKHEPKGHCHFFLGEEANAAARTLTIGRTDDGNYTARIQTEGSTAAEDTLECPGLELRNGKLIGNCPIQHPGEQGSREHFFEFSVENFPTETSTWKINFSFSDVAKEAGQPDPIHNGTGHAQH